MRLRIYFLVMVSSVLLLAGCITPRQLIGKNYHSTMVGQCQQLKVDAQYTRGLLGNEFHSNRTLTLPGIDQMTVNFVQETGLVPKGTRLAISRVKGKYIWGVVSFWNLSIRMQILDGTYKGQLVDIPTVAGGRHRSPLWIAGDEKDPDKIDLDYDPNNIRFNPDILEACKTSS